MTIKKYRKKPVTIEAIQFLYSNKTEVHSWVPGSTLDVYSMGDKRAIKLKIPTLEGVTYASEGDFVIKGVQGEFYACKPDIFEQTYVEGFPIGPIVEEEPWPENTTEIAATIAYVAPNNRSDGGWYWDVRLNGRLYAEEILPEKSRIIAEALVRKQLNEILNGGDAHREDVIE